MKNRRTRLIYGPEIWSLQQKGGISRYFENVILALSRRVDLKYDYEIVVWAESDAINSSLDSISSKFRITQPAFGSLFESDVYHSTFYNSNNQLKAKELGAKVCLTIFDMIPEKLGLNRRLRFWRDEKRKCVRAAGGIISISETTTKDILDLYDFGIPHLSTIYLGTSLYLRMEQKIQFVPEGKFFTYIGNRGGYKDFECLVRAVYDSRIPVICLGGGQFSTEEINLQNSFDVQDLFAQKEADDSLLVSTLQKSLGLICTSRYEGFSLPPLESLCCGRPVICSDIAVHRELYNDAALFYEPGNSLALAKHMNYLSNGYSLDEKLIESFRESYNWENCAQKHLEFYDKIKFETLQKRK